MPPLQEGCLAEVVLYGHSLHPLLVPAALREEHCCRVACHGQRRERIDLHEVQLSPHGQVQTHVEPLLGTMHHSRGAQELETALLVQPQQGRVREQQHLPGCSAALRVCEDCVHVGLNHCARDALAAPRGVHNHRVYADARAARLMHAHCLLLEPVALSCGTYDETHELVTMVRTVKELWCCALPVLQLLGRGRLVRRVAPRLQRGGLRHVRCRQRPEDEGRLARQGHGPRRPHAAQSSPCAPARLP
mmetsp:Transcript_99932/g.303344  ORF Transcript_99932/g.303344 Transcript_99932/m.303344 type:complete len:247 (+) Transcript_99932:896-1636(+)